MKINFTKMYWKIFKPKTLGVKLMLINDGKVLLVNHSYIKGLFLPGGGVKKGEMFEQALKREVFEELSLKIENLNLFGVYQSSKEGKNDTIVVFISNEPIDITKIKINSEICHVDFYDLNNLPTDISLGSKKRVEEYRSEHFPIAKEW